MCLNSLVLRSHELAHDCIARLVCMGTVLAHVKVFQIVCMNNIKGMGQISKLMWSHVWNEIKTLGVEFIC